MESANRRIAKNTLYMYIRLFTTMFIGLYSSRIVLQVLGVSDYGLFSVVGGVLAMFTFISGSLGAATSRFLNTEMGRSDGDVNRIFNVNVILHIILSVIIFILAETIGLWYVYNKLTVAPGKLPDAVFIYNVAIITACLGIVNSPYASLFTAHERFKFLAQFDILNTLFRFGCILLLQLYQGNYALRLYAIIMTLTTVNTFVVYHWIAGRKWPDTIRFRIVHGWHHYKEVLIFGNWNLLGTVSYMLRNSGSDLLLNSFFGTSMNGAFAIGQSINQYVTDFSLKFDSASAPQIIQSYSAKEIERYSFLTYKMGRLSLLLFLFAFFPLYIQLEFILQLWLGYVPEGTLVFTELNLIIAGWSLTCGGLYHLINASGKIKWFKIELSVLFVICLPIGYFLFRLGFPPYSLLILFLVADIIQRIVQLILARLILKFDSWKYVLEAYSRPLIIIIIMSTIIYLCNYFLLIETAIAKIFSILFCFITNSVLIYMIGITKQERIAINKRISSILFIFN